MSCQGAGCHCRAAKPVQSPAGRGWKAASTPRPGTATSASPRNTSGSASPLPARHRALPAATTSARGAGAPATAAGARRRRAAGRSGWRASRRAARQRPHRASRRRRGRPCGSSSHGSPCHAQLVGAAAPARCAVTRSPEARRTVRPSCTSGCRASWSRRDELHRASRRGARRTARRSPAAQGSGAGRCARGAAPAPRGPHASSVPSRTSGARIERGEIVDQPRGLRLHALRRARASPGSPPHIAGECRHDACRTALRRCRSVHCCRRRRRRGPRARRTRRLARDDTSSSGRSQRDAGVVAPRRASRRGPCDAGAAQRAAAAGLGLVVVMVREQHARCAPASCAACRSARSARDAPRPRCPPRARRRRSRAAVRSAIPCVRGERGAESRPLVARAATGRGARGAATTVGRSTRPLLAAPRQSSATESRPPESATATRARRRARARRAPAATARSTARRRRRRVSRR